MKINKLFIVLVITTTILLVNCKDQTNNKKNEDSFPELTGPYMGQTPPGKEPQLFMPGIVSTQGSEGMVAFLNKGKVCVYRRNQGSDAGTYYMYENDGKWTQPQKTPFSNKSPVTEFYASPDDKTLYIFDDASIPEGMPKTKSRNRLWTVEWKNDDWGKLSFVEPPLGLIGESYLSIDADKNMYSFAWIKEASSMPGEMYVSKFVDGEYQELERMEYPYNTHYHDLDPFVSPDGSYIVTHSGRAGGYSRFDTYICFKKEDGTWTHPYSVGEKIHSYGMELWTITPDGKYFFFVSTCEAGVAKENIFNKEAEKAEYDRDVYWASTSMIDEIREEVVGKECGADIIVEEYHKNGLSAAINKLKELYPKKLYEYYFPVSELFAIMDDLIKSDRINEADQYRKVLYETFDRKFGVEFGYAILHLIYDRVDEGLSLLKKMKMKYPQFDLFRNIEHYEFALGQRGKFSGKIKVLNFHIKEFPERVTDYTYYNLATAYEKVEDIAHAIEYCKKALELNSENEAAKEMLNKLKN